MPEVGCARDHLGGEHDLVLVRDGLGVVARTNLCSPLTTCESGSVVLIRPCGVLGGV